MVLLEGGGTVNRWGVSSEGIWDLVYSFSSLSASCLLVGVPLAMMYGPPESPKAMRLLACIFRTERPKKPFLLISKFSQVFCYSDRKLMDTH